MAETRNLRLVSEREIAIALLIQLASWGGGCEFSLLQFYDDDADFVSEVAETLNVKNDKCFDRKLTRVVRRLVQFGILVRSMRGTHKEYIGEPSKQCNYSFANYGKAVLIRNGERLREDGSQITGTPEWEAGFLIRHAYPEQEVDNDRRVASVGG